jgi:hypothetical protein
MIIYSQINWENDRINELFFNISFVIFGKKIIWNSLFKMILIDIFHYYYRLNYVKSYQTLMP